MNNATTSAHGGHLMPQRFYAEVTAYELEITRIIKNICKIKVIKRQLKQYNRYNSWL